MREIFFPGTTHCGGLGGGKRTEPDRRGLVVRLDPKLKLSFAGATSGGVAVSSGSRQAPEDNSLPVVGGEGTFLTPGGAG